MKKIMLKIIAVILTLTVWLPLAGACSPKSPDEIVYLTRGDRKEAEALADDPVVKNIEEKFDVKFKFIFEPSPTILEVYQTLNQFMADKDVPDMMLLKTDHPLPYDAMEDLVESDYLVDFQEYVKGRETEFPNIAQRVSDPDTDVFKASNNKLYMLPRSAYFDHVYIYRQDWLDKLELSVPQTHTEFKDTLMAFKDNDPDGKGTTGLALTYGFWFDHILAGFTGVQSFYYEADGQTLRSVWDPAGSKSDKMMDGLIYCRELYQEGLLYRDIFTSVPDRDEKLLFESGRAGAILTGMGNINQIYENLKKNCPNAEISFGVWNGPEGPARVHQRVPYFEATAVNAKSPNAGKIMQILEYLMTEEGDALTRYGIEGVHYTKDASGNMVYDKDSKNCKYYVRPIKHPLRMLVNQVNSFDEANINEPWGAAAKKADEEICLANVGVSNPADGYFSRLPKRISADIGSRPELKAQEWEAYFITGQNNKGESIALDAPTFQICWNELKIQKMHTLASEYQKLIA